MSDSQGGSGQESSSWKETEESEGSVCDSKGAPRHSGSGDCSHLVPQQIPSLLRTRQHSSCAQKQLYRALDHLLLLGRPSPPYSGSLCMATSSFCPLCRACHQWERRKLGEENIQIFASTVLASRPAFPQNDRGLWLRSGPRGAWKEIPPADTHSIYGRLVLWPPRLCLPRARAPKCPPHVTPRSVFFSAAAGEQAPRAGPEHLPAKPATEPGPAAAALPPARARPARHPRAACSQPPASAPGAAGHPAAGGGRVPWCCAGLSLGPHSGA